MNMAACMALDVCSMIQDGQRQNGANYAIDREKMSLALVHALACIWRARGRERHSEIDHAISCRVLSDPGDCNWLQESLKREERHPRPEQIIRIHI